MTREEKILEMLTGLTSDIAELKADVAVLKTDVAGLKETVSGLKDNVSALAEDIAIIKEDVAINREACNTLLEWAEQAQIEIKIPIYKKPNKPRRPPELPGAFLHVIIAPICANMTRVCRF